MRQVQEYKRIKEILISDKKQSSMHIESALKSDLLTVLGSYMEVDSDSPSLSVEVEGGVFCVKFEAVATRLKY